MEYILLIILVSIFSVQAITENSLVFNFTGAVQNYSVPSEVQSLEIEVYGAAGGGYNNGANSGGKGGLIHAVVPVQPRTMLFIYVGQAGVSKYFCNYANPVFNGGGKGFVVL